MRAGGGKDEMRKVENWETKIRIGQDIYNHEGRKMTRRGAEKMKLWKVENRETKACRTPV